MLIISYITENRLRHASGPVQTYLVRYIYTDTKKILKIVNLRKDLVSFGSGFFLWTSLVGKSLSVEQAAT